MSAEECTLTIAAINTAELMAEVDDLNAQTQSCHIGVFLFSREDIQVSIGELDNIYIEIREKNITSISTEMGASPTYKISIPTCYMDAALASDNRVGAFAYFYGQDHITVHAYGVWNKMRWAVARVAVGMTLDNMEVETPANC